MSFTRNKLKTFYSGVNYWPVERPLRPSEMHTPQYLYYALRDETTAFLEEMKDNKNRIVIPLDSEECREYAGVLLHEALFHYYKGFYNYLAARNLYSGGMLSWINITVYYAKFFLARSITTLLGIQNYQVSNRENYFLSTIGQVLHKDSATKYRITVNLDIPLQNGQIIFDLGPVSSHRDVWSSYRTQDIEALEVFPLTYSEDEATLFDIPFDYESRKRNKENYSFDGYRQLDFNINPTSFPTWFNRDYIKSNCDTLYDMETGGILLAIASMYRLFNELDVIHLPIEISKHTHMVDYCLPDGELKRKLLMICNERFQINNMESADGEAFFDNLGRSL